MENFSERIEESISAVKSVLPQKDVLVFNFKAGERSAAVIYVDGIVNKELIGEQLVRPLSVARDLNSVDAVRRALNAPELKEASSFGDCINKLLDGDVLLLVDGFAEPTIVGLKMIPVRAIAEPPTDIAVKGPRQGFIEDIKTNTSLVRMRIKTEKLKIETLTVGRQSRTAVSIFYIDGMADMSVVKRIKDKLEAVQIDYVPDSSYIVKLISERPFSLFKQTAAAEKPDIFCADLLEGRVGIISDGSPITVTVPYMIIQDFQSSEDYFVNPYRATLTRIVRLLALIVALYLPAMYVAAQLFKIQIIPFGFLLSIASGIQDLPLSPSLEMAFVLFTLEVLNEASIRMPKYVGMALSVVGALVLGDTAVSAGLVSTPAIIIIALSGICLYTVPNLTETTSVLRWILLFIAGSVGTYGIVAFTAFILYYLITADSYSAPTLAPFAPIVGRDLQDGFIKLMLLRLKKRPKTLKVQNKTRQK